MPSRTRPGKPTEARSSGLRCRCRACRPFARGARAAAGGPRPAPESLSIVPRRSSTTASMPVPPQSTARVWGPRPLRRRAAGEAFIPVKPARSAQTGHPVRELQPPPPRSTWTELEAEPRLALPVPAQPVDQGFDGPATSSGATPGERARATRLASRVSSAGCVGARAARRGRPVGRPSGWRRRARRRGLPSRRRARRAPARRPRRGGRPARSTRGPRRARPPRRRGRPWRGAGRGPVPAAGGARRRRAARRRRGRRPARAPPEGAGVVRCIDGERRSVVGQEGGRFVPRV